MGLLLRVQQAPPLLLLARPLPLLPLAARGDLPLLPLLPPLVVRREVGAQAIVCILQVTQQEVTGHLTLAIVNRGVNVQT